MQKAEAAGSRPSRAAFALFLTVLLLGAVLGPALHTHAHPAAASVAEQHSRVPAPPADDLGCAFCHAFGTPVLPAAFGDSPAAESAYYAPVTHSAAALPSFSVAPSRARAPPSA